MVASSAREKQGRREDRREMSWRRDSASRKSISNAGGSFLEFDTPQTSPRHFDKEVVVSGDCFLFKCKVENRGGIIVSGVFDIRIFTLSYMMTACLHLLGTLLAWRWLFVGHGNRSPCPTFLFYSSNEALTYAGGGLPQQQQ